MISYSTVSDYLICPRRVWYKSQGVKGPITLPLAMGSILHHTIHLALSEGKEVGPTVRESIEKLLSGEELSPHPLHKESTWNGIILKGADLAGMDLWLTQAVDLVLKELKGPVVSELVLKREIEGIELIGVVDAMWRGQIIDFKLVSPRSRGGSLLQAAFYALLSGGPTRVNYWLIRKERVPRLEVQHVPQAEDEGFLSWVLENTLKPVARMIDQELFPANPDHFLCNSEYCRFYHVCRRTE